MSSFFYKYLISDHIISANLLINLKLSVSIEKAMFYDDVHYYEFMSRPFILC